MIRLHLRIRPKRSLLDIDLPLIRRRLEKLPPVVEVRLVNDIASDATFITALVTLSGSDDADLAPVRRALLNLPRMVPFLVDARGEEIRSGGLELTELRRHASEV